MPPMGRAGGNVLVWGWDGADPQKINAALMSGGTIATTLYGLITKAVIHGFDGTITRAVNAELLGATLAATKYGLVSAAALYGYDGSTLSRLKVEDATNPNLRAALYDGATKLDIVSTYQDTTAKKGIMVEALIRGYASATNFAPVYLINAGADNQAANINALVVASILYGFDGSTFDRLRTYGTGVLKVGRAEVGLLRARLTAAGQAGTAAAHKLYWLTIYPSAAAWVCALSDATQGAQTVVWDAGNAVQAPLHVVFDPPMEFATGLYLETATNLTSVTFGYI